MSLKSPYARNLVGLQGASRLKRDTAELATASRKATKMIKGEHLSFEQKLESLGLLSLEKKTASGDIIEVYKSR